jgi:hypothetical protein
VLLADVFNRAGIIETGTGIDRAAAITEGEAAIALTELDSNAAFGAWTRDGSTGSACSGRGFVDGWTATGRDDHHQGEPNAHKWPPRLVAAGKDDLHHCTPEDFLKVNAICHGLMTHSSGSILEMLSR